MDVFAYRIAQRLLYGSVWRYATPDWCAKYLKRYIYTVNDIACRPEFNQVYVCFVCVLLTHAHRNIYINKLLCTFALLAFGGRYLSFLCVFLSLGAIKPDFCAGKRPCFAVQLWIWYDLWCVIEVYMRWHGLYQIWIKWGHRRRKRVYVRTTLYLTILIPLGRDIHI